MRDARNGKRTYSDLHDLALRELAAAKQRGADGERERVQPIIDAAREVLAQEKRGEVFTGELHGRKLEPYLRLERELGLSLAPPQADAETGGKK